MLQLTYISSIVPGVPVSVDDILRASRRNNAAVGVTGLLLYDGRRFLQALEGAADAVARTYDRIKADPRHRAIVQLSAREVSAPAFGQWAMAAEQIATSATGGIVEQVEALTAGVADPSIRELFRGFAKVRAAA